MSPLVKRTLAFLDGENLVARYQSSLEAGKVARPDVVHELDCFVWSPAFTQWSLLNVVRVTYYAVVAGAEDRRTQIEGAIGKLSYVCSDGQHTGSASVVPRVYRKESKERKSRILDIEITIDVLTAARDTPVDSILIASGDGDFAPLLREVQRTGKQVYLAAFSSGLSARLQANKDVFIDLDKLFFA